MSLFIKSPRGSCPYCSGVVKVIESEMTEVTLDDNGFPSNSKGISYSCTGWCGRCNRNVYVDPIGMGFITIPNTDSAIRLHSQMKEIFHKNNEPQDELLLNNSLITIEGNPFVK